MPEGKPSDKALFNAVRDNKLIEVERLLDAGADLRTRDGECSDTPLHVACTWGHHDIARLLIDRGADVGAQNKHGRTPLHHACNYGHPDIVRLLIDRGADIEAMDEDGRTPLQDACYYGRTDIVQLLIDRGADVNVRIEDSTTPLHWACWWGAYSTVEMLIERGADVEARDEAGHTALDCVCSLPEDNPRRERLLSLFQELAPEAYFTKFCESQNRMPGRGM